MLKVWINNHEQRGADDDGVRAAIRYFSLTLVSASASVIVPSPLVSVLARRPTSGGSVPKGRRRTELGTCVSELRQGSV